MTLQILCRCGHRHSDSGCPDCDCKFYDADVSTPLRIRKEVAHTPAHRPTEFHSGTRDDCERCSDDEPSWGGLEHFEEGH